ncbi:hypothetical protein ACJW30_02G107800 [Castanea mollissima]
MKSLQYFCCFLFLLGLVYFIHPASSANDDYTPCNGSIAECNEEDEKLMGSEISQRFLAQQKSISYGALNKNQPVCNGGSNGEAYSKSGGCLPPPSNPETRGCSKYYRYTVLSSSPPIHSLPLLLAPKKLKQRAKLRRVDVQGLQASSSVRHVQGQRGGALHHMQLQYPLGQPARPLPRAQSGGAFL